MVNTQGIAISLGEQTLRTIKQNLFWAFAYKVSLIPVATGILYFVWGQSGVPLGLQFSLGNFQPPRLALSGGS